MSLYIWDNTKEKNGIKYIFKLNEVVVYDFGYGCTGNLCSTQPENYTEKQCRQLKDHEIVLYKLLGYI